MRVLSVACAGMLAVSTASAVHAQATLKLAPAAGHPTQAVTITGSGFGDSEAVDVYIDTVDTLLLVSSATGGLSGSVTVPASEQPGTHYITAVGRRTGDAAQAAFAVTTPWLEFGFGAAHLGWNPYKNTINTSNVASLGEHWSAAINSGGATPAVNGGKVIVSTLAGVKALSVNTGAVIWSAVPTAGFYGSPAIAGNSVYVGSDAAIFYALNITTGATLWSATLGSGIYSSPVVSAGVVYIACNDDKVYALSVASGAVLWSFKTGNPINSSPAVFDGVVYVGSEDNSLYALNATTGAKLWSFATGGEVESSPVVSNGAVYFGSDDAKVYALRADGPNVGTLLWSYATGSNVYATPAVAYGTVYVGSADGNLYALNSHTGAVRWSFATGDTVWSAAVANGVVYVTSAGGTLYALDASSGATLATATLGSTFFGSPVISDGVLYLNAYTGNSYAYTQLGNVNATRIHALPPDPKTLKPDWSLFLSH